MAVDGSSKGRRKQVIADSVPGRYIKSIDLFVNYILILRVTASITV